MAQKIIVKKHPLAIRWFHWINFPVLAIMIWSGLLIYWANDVYKLGWGDKTLLKFFPDSFYKALHVPFRLAEGMSYHFLFMWLFAINGLLYFLYLLFSKEYKLIFPNKRSFRESFLVVWHDMKKAYHSILFFINFILSAIVYACFMMVNKKARDKFNKKATLAQRWNAGKQKISTLSGLPPQKKYNAAQRIAYTGVIFMGFGSLITGLAIYKPVQFYWLCAMLGGYEWARAEHFILTILFCAFFLVHIIQVILAGWQNFAGMVRGFETKKIPPVVVAQDAETEPAPSTEPSPSNA